MKAGRNPQNHEGPSSRDVEAQNYSKSWTPLFIFIWMWELRAGRNYSKSWTPLFIFIWMWKLRAGRNFSKLNRSCRGGPSKFLKIKSFLKRRAIEFFSQMKSLVKRRAIEISEQWWREEACSHGFARNRRKASLQLIRGRGEFRKRLVWNTHILKLSVCVWAIGWCSVKALLFCTCRKEVLHLNVRMWCEMRNVSDSKSSSNLINDFSVKRY